MARFPYTLVDKELQIYMPYLPMKLSYNGRSEDICGLVDSGAEISILPYKYALDLGAEWEKLPTCSAVVGPTGLHQARVLTLQVTIPGVVNDDDPLNFYLPGRRTTRT